MYRRNKIDIITVKLIYRFPSGTDVRYGAGPSLRCEVLFKRFLPFLEAFFQVGIHNLNLLIPDLLINQFDYDNTEFDDSLDMFLILDDLFCCTDQFIGLAGNINFDVIHVIPEVCTETFIYKLEILR